MTLQTVSALGTPSLRLVDFAVTYPAFSLQPMSLEIGGGERVAVVGPNGSGKSTMLKALSGRLREYGGQVIMEGTEMRSGLPRFRERIGFLPEDLLGYRWMTVRQHLEFLAPFFPTWDAGYARALLHHLRLPETAQVGTLSKGMKVKLSFVAAEAHRPPYLILDEPTSALDPVVRHELIDAVLGAVEPGVGRLVVFATHILEDVEWLASRVVVLANGRCRSDASVEKLRRRRPDRPLAGLLLDAMRHV